MQVTEQIFIQKRVRQHMLKIKLTHRRYSLQIMEQGEEKQST